jgi:hypothetical protein
MRLPACIVIGLVLLVCNAHAQDTTTNVPPATNAPPVATKETGEKTWTFGGSAYSYIVPEGRSYVQPTITADRDWLHLEARYNYENLDTASVWVGCNFSGGEKLAWELTPMLGGVFGDTTGIAPGYKGSLGWRKLELYSEGEYVVDTRSSSGDFFYNWSELSLTPVKALRVGLVTQRTRAYQSDRELQRGFLVGLALKRVNFTAYVFNPDESKPVVVLGLGLNF